MLEACRDADLAQKPLGANRCGYFGVQQLDRYIAIVPEIPGEKDHRHSAPPKLTFEAIALAQRCPELLGRILQRSSRRECIPISVPARWGRSPAE
jgi:hypothetical protein